MPNGEVECFPFDTMDQFLSEVREISKTASQEGKYATYCQDTDDFLCNIGENRYEDEIPIAGIGADNKVIDLLELMDKVKDIKI